MTIFSTRNYEILVAQKADPHVEITSLEDAARVHRASVYDHVRSRFRGDVESTMVELARHGMLLDLRHGSADAKVGSPKELGYDDYWRAVSQIAAMSKRDSDPENIAVHFVEEHPFIKEHEWRADVLRHTAHPEALVRGDSPFDPLFDPPRSDEVKLSSFASQAARAAMVADVWHELRSAVPHYRPNQRTCTTHLRAAEYPCTLRRLDDFEDVSYGNDGNDSVQFRIGRRWYRLFVGPSFEYLRRTYEDLARSQGFASIEGYLNLPEDEELSDVDLEMELRHDYEGHDEYPRFQLQSGDDPEEAYQGDVDLVTNDEGELLEYLGKSVVATRRQQLGLRPNAGRSYLERAIEHYGLTERWPDAGYILPDGSLLDFSEGGGMGRSQDHRNVGFLLTTKREFSGFEGMRRFMEVTGALRFLPESLAFDIYTKPTTEQIAKMLEIIEDAGRPPILEMERTGAAKFNREYEEWNVRDFARDVRSYWSEPTATPNPFLGPRLLQRQELRGTARGLARLGAEHVDWSLLDEDPWSLPPGAEWIVVLRCGVEGRIKGPLSRRYERMSYAGMREQELASGRAIARGCSLDVISDRDLWRGWGTETPEYLALSLPALFERYHR